MRRSRRKPPPPHTDVWLPGFAARLQRMMASEARAKADDDVARAKLARARIEVIERLVTDAETRGWPKGRPTLGAHLVDRGVVQTPLGGAATKHNSRPRSTN